MHYLNCPHCQHAIAMPPPKDAGKLFDCPRCAQPYRFTGAGALAVVRWQPAVSPSERWAWVGRIAGIAGVAAFATLLFAALTAVPSGFNDAMASQRVALPDLEVIETHAGVSYIHGTVLNNTDRTYGYAQVEITLFAEDGAVVGSTMDNINNLGPHERWRFEAYPFGHGYARYEIRDVSGF